MIILSFEGIKKSHRLERMVTLVVGCAVNEDPFFRNCLELHGLSACALGNPGPTLHLLLFLDFMVVII